MRFFKYFKDEAELVLLDGAIFWLPTGSTSKSSRFTAYGRALRAPNGYFGENWDAFSDCLLELDWIDSFEVFLIHRELPHLSQEETAIYLDILQHAMTTWSDKKTDELSHLYPSFIPHRLTIYSPREIEELVSSFVGGGASHSHSSGA
ncbi:barstar family protein [Roseibium sp.]|uniref:barstar family protein n=1 Tax=Roseibium sp. TaxID=1936156 RepID=UPI001B0D705C|nr:barstar family protein [Roseibium sp.]MBO6858022.1 barstar family protein [Roseibium sp.]